MTGLPFVDAHMRELKKYGFMSNRGRQNVSSFFAKYLNQDWRIGAAWFESLLIDYDVSSNYGNWQYNAGVGVDPRENRIFNVIKQGETYDEKGTYVKKWISELSKPPKDFIHKPFILTKEEMNVYNFYLGKDYPYPIISTKIIDSYKKKSRKFYSFIF